MRLLPKLNSELLSKFGATGGLLGLMYFLHNLQLPMDGRVLKIGGIGTIPYIISQMLVNVITEVTTKGKELKADGEYGKKTLKKLTRDIAMVIATIIAFATHVGKGNMLEVPLQIATSGLMTYTLQNSEEKVLGNAHTHAMVVEVLSGVPKILQEIITTTGFDGLAQMGALTLPILVFTYLYGKQTQEVSVYKASKPYTQHSVTGGMYDKDSQEVVVEWLETGTQRVHKLPLRPKYMGLSAIYTASLWSGSLFFFLPQLSLHIGGMLVFAILAVFFYVQQSHVELDLQSLTHHLKQACLSIKNIRPGADTLAYLKEQFKHMLVLGLPLMLALVIYPLVITQWLGISLISVSCLVPLLCQQFSQIKAETQSYMATDYREYTHHLSQQRVV